MNDRIEDRISFTGLRRSLATALLVALLLPGTVALGQSSQSSREPVGRVVSTRGAVFAQAPGEERRILQCRDAVFEGDRIMTLDGSDVGIDASTYYVRLGQNSTVRLGQNSTAEIGALEPGAVGSPPRLDLESGHLRLIDTADGAGPSAELATPGLVLARTGGDQDALVFAEKAGVVSMVCAYGSDLEVARRSDPATVLTATSGGCVVGKPREALFTAEASHPQLAVLMRDACEEIAAVPVSGRFSPGSVSLGPAALAGSGGGAAPPPGPPPFGPATPQPCAGGCTRGGTPTGPGLPTNFPFVPPVVPAP